MIKELQGKALIKKEAKRIVQVVGTMIRTADIQDYKELGLPEHYRQGILETVIQELEKSV
jgi:methylmalonyl-CoA mutase cobalamin-binding subunit